ncbi:MAG: 3'-5' exonuclease [Nibricoccus sp.]
MRWTDVPIHFVDFEGSLSSGVLEYGVVTFLGGEIVETATRLCAAAGRIRPEDAAVHRLTERVVEGSAPFSSDFDFFAGLRERGPFAAHFAGTENSLLKGVWPYTRQAPDFSHPQRVTTEWGPWIDSGRLCAELLPGCGSLQLEVLVQKLGLANALEEVAKRHCPAERCFFHAALYDALAGILVLRRVLAADYRDQPIAWVLQMSTGSPVKKSDFQQDTLF